MLKCHSSRRNRLDHAVLNQRLEGAVSYDRIAGYFRSSLFEVAGEAIAKVTGPVRIICNSDLDQQDIVTAAAAQAALRQSWCSGRPEEAPPSAIPRYRALYEALTCKKMEVRVLPDSAFGLIHGKAGVVRYADGSATTFLGSVNESASGWKVNYELLWEDNDPETIAWVQEEFDTLWNDARAVNLACCPFIVQDVQRIISRRVIEPEELKAISDPTMRRTRGYLEATINPATGGYLLPKVAVKLFGEENESALVLGGYLLEAYQEAEAFSLLLQQRVQGAGFFKTLLLRRLGSSMEAGRRTVQRLLGEEPDNPDDEDDDDAEEEAPPQVGRPPQGVSDFKNFTAGEIASLRRCFQLLRQGGNSDPKLEALSRYLLGAHLGVECSWLDLGCILFSQYYDTVRWVGDELAKRVEFANMDIGLYAGSARSGFWREGKFQRCKRDALKERVRTGDLKLLLGTDAASEGLNLQRLGTLINIDLPWNPTRLEQRKGRIQRIGQARSEIWIANLRYRDSVEDRVHRVLADRLESIHGLFGQIPDTLEDVWVQVALNNKQAALQLIDQTTATRNPFDVKYSKVEDADWETCASVLNAVSVKELFSRSW